jgi:ADP-ribose pyrophosphatase YjhB (NUDIX family)
VTVDVVLFSIRPDESGRPALQVLLVRRDHEPFAGRWALPGDFVRAEECLSDAAARVLEVKTGLGTAYLEQLYTFGQPERDPRRRVVTVAYFALVRPEQAEIATSERADDVRWWPVGKLPGPLGFDHGAILDYALWRLRNKVSYAHIAFQFLAPTFTLAQLRAVYEVILGRKLDPTNFRRHVESTGTIVPTDERLAGGRHRPPRLYRCAVGPNALFQGPPS